MKDFKTRITSKVTLLAIIAQVVLVVGLFTTPEISTTVSVILVAIVEILTLLGVVNNPTVREDW